MFPRVPYFTPFRSSISHFQYIYIFLFSHMGQGKHCLKFESNLHIGYTEINSKHGRETDERATDEFRAQLKLKHLQAILLRFSVFLSYPPLHCMPKSVQFTLRVIFGSYRMLFCHICHLFKINHSNKNK